MRNAPLAGGARDVKRSAGSASFTADAPPAQEPDHLDFANEAARAELGRHWVAPEARTFIDLPPDIVRQRRDRAAWWGGA